MNKTISVRCVVCDKIFNKPLKRFNETIKLGQRHVCSRKCASRLTNDQRHCEPATANAKHVRKDKEKFPERTSARILVRRALKTGKLIPPTECAYCSSNDQPLEAHHPDHYHPFLLAFLCKKCHAFADTQLDKLEDLAIDYSESC